jgi:hypothetical protein
MAKKKKRLTRKQLKQQRQAAIERRRKQTGWKPRPAQPSNELAEDMLPLLGSYQGGPATPADMERIMMPMLDSAHLIEEPEFDDLMLDPAECVMAFIEIGEEIGFEPESFDELSKEELDDRQMEMLQRTTKRLVTKSVRRDILAALDKLRRRLKTSGSKMEVARVAALQSFLTEEKSSEFWSMVGLVQALIQRSTTLGFEFMEASEETPDLALLDEEEGETPTPFIRRLTGSRLGKKAESVLSSIPGIQGFVTKQTDKIWEEGSNAVFEGELYLGLYTEDELITAAEMMQDALGIDPAAETIPQEVVSVGMTEKKITALIARFDDYITGLFTPERLDELRQHLHQVVKASAFDEKWMSFMLLLEEDMAAEDALDHEMGFLIGTLFGELRTAMRETRAEVES